MEAVAMNQESTNRKAVHLVVEQNIWYSDRQQAWQLDQSGQKDNENSEEQKWITIIFFLIFSVTKLYFI